MSEFGPSQTTEYSISRRQLLAGTAAVMGTSAWTVGSTGARYQETTVAGDTIGVDAQPNVNYIITDKSKNTNAAYEVQWEVEWVADFGDLVIDVQNLQASDENASYTKGKTGSISYPKNQNSDGGHEGDTYRFTFTVKNSNDVTMYQEQVDDVADGDGTSDGDFGSVNSPELVSMTVIDNAQNNNANYRVEWEVTNLSEFDEVLVTFDHVGYDNWGNYDETSNDADGWVEWSRGGVGGHDYDITVDVYDTSGVPVDSHTISDEVGNGGESWTA